MQSRVYKNLNNGLWSIKQRVSGRWVVVGHARQVSMINVSASVSDKRHDHVRKGNHREVFAWLNGDIVQVDGFVSYQGRDVTCADSHHVGFSTDDLERVTFHPFAPVKRGFFWVTGDDFDGAYRAVFTSSAEVFCYV